MGQTLATAAQWTSTHEGGRRKLEYTPMNEAILKSIVQFSKSYSSRRPEEGQLVFKKPLTWITNLNASKFTHGFKQIGDDIVSDAVDDKTGLPLVKYEGGSHGGEKTITVYSFEYVERILQCAGDSKINEVRACLEANPDVTAVMLGERFATEKGSDGSLLRFIEDMAKEVSDKAKDKDNEVAQREMQEKESTLKIVLDIQRLDNAMLNMALTNKISEVRLSPTQIEREVSTLDRFSGPLVEKHILKDIVFTDSFVYKNGCRAPAWRQVHGDISYVKVKTHEGKTLYITGSTDGYYLNKGLTEKGLLNHSKEGEIYKDLRSLLKDQSEHFAELIDDKNFFLEDERDDEYALAKLNDSDADDEDGDHFHEKRITKKDSNRRYEASTNWKALGLKYEKVDDEKLSPKSKSEKESSSKSMAVAKISKKGGRSSLILAPEMYETSSSEDGSEEELVDRRADQGIDQPGEYWQIQKLIKYLKGGNQTATIIALCALRDFNLSLETSQTAIRDVGGLEVLINLLGTQEPKCKIGALKILKEISGNHNVRRAIADLGGLQTMVDLLSDSNKELKCLAAETIGNIAKFRRARRTVRLNGGIQKLVALLDLGPQNRMEGLAGSHVAEDKIAVARSGALALWSLSKSTLNKKAMQMSGVIPLLAALLRREPIQEDMLNPVVGTLQECASEESYRLAVRTEGMVEPLVNTLQQTTSAELQMHSANAIFKCAEDEDIRDLVRKYDGLRCLVSLLDNTEDKGLLAAATGAIWKCSKSEKNIRIFQNEKAIEKLVALLSNQPEEVLVNVVGALSELAKADGNTSVIRKCGGIPPLVNLLTGTNEDLLVNTSNALGECALELENMSIIDRQDGVRLIWSLLKHQSRSVQAAAAKALCPCIENAKESGEMVRSFVGGLELVVNLLKSKHSEVLANVCAAIAKIAADEENLAVITDHGVVPMLAQLTPTSDDNLREHLAEAIAQCCSWGNNREAFGNEGAVALLVKYLKSKNPKVHRSTARALNQLSRNPENCITMHEAGVVKLLLNMVASGNSVLQENAAGCIGNIRRLALANEKSRTSNSNKK